MILRGEPYLFMNAVEQEQAGFGQGYVVCRRELKMAALTKILVEQEKKKVVVLFRTCADLRLVERLCQAMNIYAFAVHGSQETAERASAYFQFMEQPSGTLLASHSLSKLLYLDPVHTTVWFTVPNGEEEQRKVGHNTLVMIQTGDSGSLAHVKTELRLEEFSMDEEDLERIEQTIQAHVARSKTLRALAA